VCSWCVMRAQATVRGGVEARVGCKQGLNHRRRRYIWRIASTNPQGHYWLEMAFWGLGRAWHTDVQIGGVIGEAPAGVCGAVNEQHVGAPVPCMLVGLEARAAGGRVEGAQLRQEAAANAAASRAPALYEEKPCWVVSWFEHKRTAMVTAAMPRWLCWTDQQDGDDLNPSPRTDTTSGAQQMLLSKCAGKVGITKAGDICQGIHSTSAVPEQAPAGSPRNGRFPTGNVQAGRRRRTR